VRLSGLREHTAKIENLGYFYKKVISIINLTKNVSEFLKKTGFSEKFRGF